MAAGALIVLGAVSTYLIRRPAGPISVTPGPVGPDRDGDTGRTPANPEAELPASVPLRTLVLQGRAAVCDALIDYNEVDRSFGSTTRDNALRRADRCNAFLVRFDLAKLEVPPKARVAKAMVSFFVWDPSSQGKTKVCAFPMKTEWDEVTTRRLLGGTVRGTTIRDRR